MEGDNNLENTDRRGVLARSSSDESALTAANAKKGEKKAWTDEKHNLYLNRLERSFVTQLNQSKELPVRSSDEVQKRAGPCQDEFADIDKDSDQFIVLRNGCWLKIMYQRIRPSFRSSACSVIPCKRLCDAENHEKETASHALSNFSSILPSTSDGSAFCTKEGTGQNFWDDDSCDKTVIEFSTKRFRTASAEAQDHIVPSKKSLRTDTN